MDIQINYGIKTGFNEAFIVSDIMRKQLIEEDPKSAEIIRPILRGKDIKRYDYNFAEKWLINSHNGLKGSGLKPIKIDDYPAVKRHLNKFYPELKKRTDQGDTIYNLRNCAYMEDFFRQKIIFQEMVQEPSFILDNEGKFMCLDTARIITGQNLEVVLAVLNSKIFFYSVKLFYGGGALGEKGIRMKHTFFENFPMPNLKIDQVNNIQRIIKNPSESNLKEIDSMLYKSFLLSEEEINAIEAQ